MVRSGTMGRGFSSHGSFWGVHGARKSRMEAAFLFSFSVAAVGDEVSVFHICT